MTHIDPFAPGDSPQHPANWATMTDLVEQADQQVLDLIADLHQWRRDHLSAAAETGVDFAAEALEERHERYNEYFDEYGAEAEDYRKGGEFLPFPELLRRAVFADLDDEEIDEWKALFEQNSTEDERDPLWIEGVLPDLAELRARDDVARLSAEAAEKAQGDGTPVPEMLLTPPRSNALKEEWVDYALAVDKARGGTLTPEQAGTMSIADLKAAYKPQAS